MSFAILLRQLPLLLTAALAIALLWLKPAREISAACVILAYAALCLWTWLKQPRVLTKALPQSGICVAYASQSGQAQHLAQLSVSQLQTAGLEAHAVAINHLRTQDLQGVVLFIASTYGEGEAPDNATRLNALLQQPTLDLSQLQYAVLALGDSNYSQFCAFGLTLDKQLQQHAAQRLFEPLCSDQCDAETLRKWQQQLAQLSDQDDYHAWQAQAWQSAQLIGRDCLNPDSNAAKVFELTLSADASLGHWQAGDLLEVLPEVAPPEAFGLQKSEQRTTQATAPTPRLYSIASVPNDGNLQLLVRQMHHADGRLGLASGWLTANAALGSAINVRLRSNPSFHAPLASVPMLLIGNGTGLAGLRAHLRARPEGSRNWLIFGERTQAHDFIGQAELLNWQASGHLERLDLAFSQDQAEKRYVQHLLQQHTPELLSWIKAGAAIYLCGSLKGMGEAVHQLLIEQLGAECVSTLQHQGRYRRDLY